MTTPAWTLAVVVCVAAWVVVGLAWLLPKKVALLKRVGLHATNQHLIELAKQGDSEARWLKSRTARYVWAGLATALVLAMLKPR